MRFRDKAYKVSITQWKLNKYMESIIKGALHWKRYLPTMLEMLLESHKVTQETQGINRHLILQACFQITFIMISKSQNYTQNDLSIAERCISVQAANESNYKAQDENTYGEVALIRINIGPYTMTILEDTRTYKFWQVSQDILLLFISHLITMPCTSFSHILSTC